MSFAVRQAWPGDIDALAAVAASAQADPDRFIGYLGDDAGAIVADLTEIDGVEHWSDATHVALDDVRNVIGWIAAETDADLGRVWWWGPFLADGNEALRDPIADALFSVAECSLSGVSEHEFAIDERSAFLRRFVERHGFVAHEGSVVLNTAGMLGVATTPNSAVVEMAEEHHDAVAALHDQIFPGTHTPGALLVSQTDERRQRFVAVVEDEVIGYVATIFENDQSLYIDYLGVAGEHRAAGWGRMLITAAMQARHGDATHAHLTVRSANDAARRLYASLGFTEERVLVPMRRGFTLI
ncbi:MAG: ribosomal protein S18 acetylase RimI-like enzyme [Ilumatobacter sp.]|jgi:ribosomal protein S18 acetylase RimI-like enzyme